MSPRPPVLTCGRVNVAKDCPGFLRGKGRPTRDEGQMGPSSAAPLSAQGLANDPFAAVGAVRASGCARRWADLSPGARVAVTIVGAVQVGLQISALVDLARPDSGRVPGPRWAWVLVGYINFVGPISYFAFERRGSRSLRPS